MNQKEFLSRLADTLDRDDTIEADQSVELIQEWDSLGILSVIGLLIDLDLKVDPMTIREIKNISQLLEIVKPTIHE